MKKKKLVFLLVIISILGIFIFQLRKSSEIKLGEEPTFWVVSDVHLIANSLHDDGEEFQRIKQTSAGKELDYQEESIHALVDSAIKEKISGLIITGDLTLNGEKKSAEKLAELLAPLEENGIMSLVIPGNHDIHDGWARKFDVSYSLSKGEVSDKNIFNLFVVICDFVGFEGHWFNVQASSLGGIVRPKMNLIKKTADSCDGEVGWRDYFYVISRG